MSKSIACPYCDKGYCGVSPAHGEAIDCNACDGHGRITPEIFKECHEARMQQSGDLWTIHAMAQQGMWDELKTMLLEAPTNKETR